MPRPIYSTDVQRFWATPRIKLTLLHENNKGVDQPAHVCRLIGAFVIRSLQTKIYMYKLSLKLTFLLVSVAKQTG